MESPTRREFFGQIQLLFKSSMREGRIVGQGRGTGARSWKPRVPRHLVGRLAFAVVPPENRPHRRSRGDRQAIGDRPFGRLREAVNRSMLRGRPRRDLRRDPPAGSTGWQPSLTDAALRRGVTASRRWLATWLPHYARVRVTTAERSMPPAFAGRQEKQCLHAFGVRCVPAGGGADAQERLLMVRFRVNALLISNQLIAAPVTHS